MNRISKWLMNRKATTTTTPSPISEVSLCCVCGQVFVNVKEVPPEHLCIRQMNRPTYSWSTMGTTSNSTTDYRDITITTLEEEDAIPE